MAATMTGRRAGAALWVLLASALPLWLQAASQERLALRPSAPRFENVPASGFARAPEGHVLISWSLASQPATEGQNTTFELQQDRDSHFPKPVTRRVGADSSSFLSGLPEGSVYVRVRAIGPEGVKGAWSSPLQIEVTYPSAAVLRNLMALGSFLFLSTVALIWSGHRRSLRALAAGPDLPKGPE